MSPKPILRRCVTCKKMANRQQFFKITKDYRDGLVIENGMGRSAYICRNDICLTEAWRRKRLQKALRCQIDPTIIEILQENLKTWNIS